ncbi:unnamed protein product [Blepharisma stoltei]|uniref:EF-hand domain-containing protein n=1 Tax=Blepharisma stoltei TaxID=1481888 RepID=A0AAU9KEX5_9CILI|nr:unnamed protein product [Blepharisma stoltei]
MEENDLDYFGDLDNITLHQLNNTMHIRPNFVPDLNVSAIEEKSPNLGETLTLPPINISDNLKKSETLKKDKFKPRRFFDYSNEELKNSEKILKLKELRFNMIKQKLKERIIKEQIQPKMNHSFTVADVKTINRELSIENVLERAEERRKKKISRDLNDQYEIKVEKRIKASKTIVKKGLKYNQSFVLSTLHAVLSENLRAVEATLDSANDDYERMLRANVRDQYNRTPLHYAAAMGFEKALVMLLEVGADPRLIDEKGRTPLHYSSFQDNVKLVEYLLRGAKNACKTINLMKTKENHFTIARLIKYRKYKPIVSEKSESLPISHEKSRERFFQNLDLSCFHEGIQQMIRKMDQSEEISVSQNKIEKQKYINWVDECGRSALHFAVMNNKYQIVRFLLEGGANPRQEDLLQKRPIELSNDKKITSLLVSMIRHSVSVGKIKILKPSEILDNRDLQALDEKEVLQHIHGDLSENYLISAIKKKNIEAVSILLEKKASPLHANKRGWNALHFAVAAGYLKTLKLLLEGSVDGDVDMHFGVKSWVSQSWKASDEQTQEGWNALHIACIFAPINIVQYLLKIFKIRETICIDPEAPIELQRAGISSLSKVLEIPCSRKATPFLLAVQNKRLDLAQLLIEHGSSIYAKNEKLQNALHISTLQSHAEMIEFLIKLDSDKNILRGQSDIRQRKPKDLDSSSKLTDSFYHIWDHAKDGSAEKIRQCIESKKYSVNDQTPKKKLSALHVAVENRQLMAIRTLIQMGANISLLTASGKTALDIAIDMMDLIYEKVVIRLLKGETNLTENIYTKDELENYYNELKKDFKNKSFTSNPKKINKFSTQKFREDFREEAEKYWAMMKEKLIEKKTSVNELFEKMDADQDTSLTFQEFENMLLWLELPIDHALALKLSGFADINQNGLIEYSEILLNLQNVTLKEQYLSQIPTEVPRLHLHKLSETFNHN